MGLFIMLSRSSAKSGQSRLRTAQAPLRSAQPLRTFATVQSDIFKPTKYGGKYTVTLIPGDGIGAEVAEAVKTIFKADNVPIEWEQVDVSGVDTGNKHSEAQQARSERYSAHSHREVRSPVVQRRPATRA